jgi:hypothetical protein
MLIVECFPNNTPGRRPALQSNCLLPAAIGAADGEVNQDFAQLGTVARAAKTNLTHTRSDALSREIEAHRKTILMHPRSFNDQSGCRERNADP